MMSPMAWTATQALRCSPKRGASRLAGRTQQPVLETIQRRRRPMSAYDLAAALQIGRDAIYRACSELVEQGKLRRIRGPIGPNGRAVVIFDRVQLPRPCRHASVIRQALVDGPRGRGDLLRETQLKPAMLDGLLRRMVAHDELIAEEDPLVGKRFIYRLAR